MNVTSRETAIVENTTQTQQTIACQIGSPSEKSLGPVVLPAIHTSLEDVNSLIVETYGARPALLIQNMIKK
ncbi:unnamed protein product [Auanema sp. JU1783]|nr:unnamed protein product [Auanema sp. JU1783]